MHISHSVFDAYLAQRYPRRANLRNLVSNEVRRSFHHFFRVARPAIEELAAKRGTKTAAGLLAMVASHGLRLTDGRVVAPDNLWSVVPEVSWALSELRPDQFTPMPFPGAFTLIQKIHDVFGWPLPTVPPLRHNRARFLYYGELNNVWQQEREARRLSPNDFQIYLYEFGPLFLDPQEFEAKKPDPFRAWIAVVGRSSDEHDIFEKWLPGQPEFWPVPPGVRKGDLVFLYRTAPVSAVVGFAFARWDAFHDPFFDSGALACTDLVMLEHLPPVNFAEIWSHPILAQTAFAKLNGNASALSIEQYAALRDFFVERGVGWERFPGLASVHATEDVFEERDVEIHVVEPLLERLGLVERWRRQVPIRAGRGARIFPDYVIDGIERSGVWEGRAVLETKFRIRNQLELHEAYLQAQSYALLLQARTIAVTSADGIWWWRAKAGRFEERTMAKSSWNELSGKALADLRHALAGA